MRRALILVLLALSAAACGGGDGDTSAADPATQACGPEQPSATTFPQLPDRFPTPDEVSYTGERSDGSDSVVDASFDGPLDVAVEAYRDAFRLAGYTAGEAGGAPPKAVLPFEGGGATGTVELDQECRDRTTVTIRFKPA